MKTELGGLTSVGRQLLGKLLRASKESFTVAEASQILDVSRYRAASLLAMWTRNGWLHRVCRGLYIPVPLQSPSVDVTTEEPWLIAHKLFSPCYIGGWTAAHYWGLTEQIFNSIYVMTTKKVHQREQSLSGVAFKVKTVLPKKIFGTQTIWSGKVKISISDPTKTVVDGLNDPAVFGGIRMVADVLSAYIRSKEFNQSTLFEYAHVMGNSVVYKRLGFLVELLKFDGANAIVLVCKDNLKSGYSQLDPATPGDRLETRWNLWVPKSFNIKDQA
ncbi:MAG TPA: type IV toxin-antitoxin system AbiEi family antitoxin [Gammaproteobacteria bacterium]|jgi:predicted transcriptional regulator of viral defense system|nr:type IV toxin-antitoxin system AbiEi family antitoxin [Gammaproteobacteria bacterium]